MRVTYLNARNAAYFCAAMIVLTSSTSAQVFTQDADAVVGYTPQGSGQALYGGFGLDSGQNPAYQIYRKFTESTNQTAQAVASNVEGNPGEMEWSGINQRAGADEGITAPGMFIGTRSGGNEDGTASTYQSELLYFKGQFDNTGSATTSDSNKRTQWDTRFGFMERPDDYIDLVEPNSSQLDLWTGAYNTDAVYSQVLIKGDDSAETSNVSTQHTKGGSFLLQSGDPLTEIGDERDRTNNPMTRIRAGSGEELDDAGSLVDAGVAYDDPIEVSWGMRLADPENPVPDFAREVEFWVKTGNLITSGIFDPGDEDNLPFDVPNPGNDSGSDYTDGFFDWQNAVPVFFAGGQGNIGDGTGQMGIFIPGDYDASGAVDLDDFNRFAANFGGVDTTYSTGDQTQDGLTDIADGEAWAGVAGAEAKSDVIDAVNADATAGGSLYDFDGSGSTDSADVTLVTDLLGVGGVVGDCNGDGVIDVNDANCTPAAELSDFLAANGLLLGDADGDNQVQFPDFAILADNFGNAGQYTDGDFDKDGSVQFGDFAILADNFGQTSGATAAVPEPSALILLGLACPLLIRGFRAGRC